MTNVTKRKQKLQNIVQDSIAHNDGNAMSIVA